MLDFFFLSCVNLNWNSIWCFYILYSSSVFIFIQGNVAEYTLKAISRARVTPKCACCMRWVSSESYGPYEWVMLTMTSPQPVLLSSCSLMPRASFVESTHFYLVFLFSCCLLFFLTSLLFSKNPAFLWCAQSRTSSVLYLFGIFCLPSAMFQA